MLYTRATVYGLKTHFHIQFYDEVERLIGPGTDQKFLEVVPKLIKYGKTIEESATVQSVSKQWDCKLEGEPYL